jgi:hypothetical protein
MWESIFCISNKKLKLITQTENRKTEKKKLLFGCAMRSKLVTKIHIWDLLTLSSQTHIVNTEWSFGPFQVTQPNPDCRLADQTQLIPIETERSSTKLANCLKRH